MELKFLNTVDQHLINEEENQMYKTGEKPGKGIYQCTKCGQLVRLDDHTDTLPPCPKCGNTTYRKVR